MYFYRYTHLVYTMRKPEFIDMKGLLSFYIMWLLGRRKMCSSELIEELGNRRFDEPSPGTLYPALNALKADGLVQSERDDKKVVYSVTLKGKSDLALAITYFKNIYGEIVTGESVSYMHKPREVKQVKETRVSEAEPETKNKKDELEIGYI